MHGAFSAYYLHHSTVECTIPQTPEAEPGRFASAPTVDDIYAGASTPDDICAVLRDLGLVKVADRAAELSKLHEDDADEPQMNTASLRRLAETLCRNPQLQRPKLSLTEEGFVHAWWQTAQGGTVAMTFRPDGPVEFGAISEPAGRGVELLRIGGLHHPDVAIGALRWFTTRLVTP